MSKRKAWLIDAMLAGYHNDNREFTRLLIEARINRPALHEAWRNGVKAKQAGIPCKCYRCKTLME